MIAPQDPVDPRLLKRVRLPSGEQIPGLGQGTWEMATDSKKRQTEIHSLRLGIELGMGLIDTAEMYGEGAAEELVGEAIHGLRENVFLVSKAYPHNASREKLIRACENSLKRLRTDRLDLYLLHWRGEVPLAETVETFTHLAFTGKIRYWGVSNFTVADMQEILQLPHGGAVATNQVLYNLSRRGVEWDLLPWCRQRNIPIMAYSPIARGDLSHPTLNLIAARHHKTPHQIALNWVLRQNQVIAIPKAANPDHLRANHAALDIQLTARDLLELDEAFPPPFQARSLEMI